MRSFKKGWSVSGPSCLVWPSRVVYLESTACFDQTGQNEVFVTDFWPLASSAASWAEFWLNWTFLSNVAQNRLMGWKHWVDAFRWKSSLADFWFTFTLVCRAATEATCCSFQCSVWSLPILFCFCYGIVELSSQ